MKSETSLKCKHGFTQIELMVSIAIISVFFLAIVGGFGPLAKGIFINKANTLSTNLVQEQIEKLKSVSYYRLLVTPNPKQYSSYSIPADDTYYPPEQIQAGKIKFTRLTYVEVAQEVSGDIQTLSPTTPDTGLKLITVTVLWGAAGGEKYVQLKNIMSNPEVTMADAGFNGTVSDADTTNPIDGAQVTTAENSGWIDITGTNGAYLLSAVEGSYNIVAKAQGYFTQSILKSVASNQTVTQDFTLNPMDSATVTGSVWKNDHVVFSQVVGSSATADGFEQEYVELFNPTTSQFGMCGYSVVFGSYAVHHLYYMSESDVAKRVLNLDYYTKNIPPLGYYLIANTTTLTIDGSDITADAVFDPAIPGYPDVIKDPDAGGFGLLSVSGGADWIDAVGWDRNGGAKTAPIYETEGLDENIGLEQGEQYVRLCSTSTVMLIGQGHCYDSGNNNVDFVRKTHAFFIPPRNSGDTGTVISGVPLAGVAVTLNDELSSGTSTFFTGSPPFAKFVLSNVATGTWICIISGEGYYHKISTVPIPTAGTYSIPNASTEPPWSLVGYPAVFLSSVATQGYVSGKVTDAGSMVIAIPYITISDGYNTVATDINGNYLLETSTGIYTITANPNGLNPAYVTQSQTGVIINLGEITSGIDFRLSEGGRIRGFVTRDGINPIPNVLFIAQYANGNSQDEEVSGNDGYFTLVNLSTGTYEVYPILDSGETSTPETEPNVLLDEAGATVFSATFTITGAFGEVVGSVTDSGDPIETGVLIVVTTSTFAGSPPEPPTISSATLSSGALYMGSSSENGTFTVDVRGSTSTAYNIYAFYPKFSGSTVEVKYNLSLSKYVTASATTTVNFSTWLP